LDRIHYRRLQDLTTAARLKRHPPRFNLLLKTSGAGQGSNPNPAPHHI